MEVGQLRIVFMGSPEFAVPSLNALVDAGHNVVAAYAQPPRPAGRGKAERKTAIHERAEKLGIEVRTPRTLRDEEEQARFRGLDADLAVVAAYGLILPKPILEAPKAGCINVHASLLPRWRGAAPIERAIMAGDAQTGVCIMRVTAGLDSGPVCLAAAEPIRPDDTYATLAARLEERGAELLVRALDERPECVEQDEARVTYAEKIGAADRTLDPAAPPVEQERVVRALHPHIGARLPLEDGTFLGVRQARVSDDGARLELVEVQPPGGRPMAYDAYVRGHAAR